MKKLLHTTILLFLFSMSYAELSIIKTISPNYETENRDFNSIAISNLDDIYIADGVKHEILRISFNGEIINKIGGFGWDENSLNSPTDICINSGLNIIISDKNNNRLIRYDKNLNFISAFPNDNSFLELAYPKNCEITQNGILFILQENNYEILKLEIDSDSYSVIGNNVHKEFELIEPIDIYLTKKENLLILEQSGKILKYDIFGSPLEILTLKINTFVPQKIISKKDQIYILSENGEIFRNKQTGWNRIFSSSDVKINDFAIIDNQFFLLTKNGKILICQNEQD